jgi:monothiol glutaredoxin
MANEINEQIDELVKSNKVVLFMKGTRMFPQCGFSARAVDIFKRVGVTFKDVNVLADPNLRAGIKDYSNWPTIPQVYVDGEFLGGSDILLEMFENGELHQMLGVAAEDPSKIEPPELTVTPAAAKAFADALAESGDDVLRLTVPPTFAYDLYIGPKQHDDFVVETGGLKVHVAPRDAVRATGTTIDFVDGPDGAGFRIDNPNEPPKMRNLSPQALKAALDGSTEVHLYDVRSEQERQLARIEQGRPLDAEALAEIEKLDKDAMIVLYCHHGVRSRGPAQQLVEQGYRNVHNLTGGIDAWSAMVDASVPRY